ncbi:hypothetical protein [Sphingomonas elodea]|nr:hypothetical protein [Sphingomonas elodea]
MRTTDIIARLQLQADQFSSESGKRFAELAARAKTASGSVRREFVSSFAEVQRVAQTALQMPRAQGGGLDLSREIAQLKAQEAAAENAAQGMRELQTAASAAAARGGAVAESQRQIADSAMVAERAAEEEVSAIRRKITAYEELQAELAQTVSGTRVLTQEEQRLAGASNAGRYAMANIGQQAVDFAVQVQSGQSAVTAFVQQFPQATAAMAGLEGGAGKLGAFLTGPWGTALTIATVVAVPFVAKLLDGADAAKEQAKHLADAAEAADTFGNAQTLLGKIMDLTTGKLKTQNAYLIQAINLQARANIVTATKKQADATAALKAFGDPTLVENAGVSAASIGSVTAGAPNMDGAQQQATALAGKLAPLKAVITDYINLVNDPRAKPEQLMAGFEAALGRIEKLGKAGKLAGRDLLDAQAAVLAVGTAISDKQANQEIVEAIQTGKLSSGLKIVKPPKPKKPKKEPDFSRADDSAEQMIASINAEWDEQPRLIDRARVETLRLDNLIAQLEKRKVMTPEVARLIGLAKEAKENIQEGLDRPFREFVKAQRESLEVGNLVLAGRDADAEALQNILRLQDQGKQLTDEQVQSVYRLAQQHQAINRLLEDQRRIVGIYENAWSGVLEQVDGVFAKIQGNSGGIVGVAQKLQRDLLSNALFGGIDRDIEEYVRRVTGKRTPAEILQDQAKDAGSALAFSVTGASTAVTSFADTVLDATLRIRGANPTVFRNATALAASSFTTAMGGGGFVPDESNIVVTGQRAAGVGETLGIVRSSAVLERVVDKFSANLSHLGIDLPKQLTSGLKQQLPTILEGAAFGGIGGSVFTALGGGKGDKTAEGIGGILGEYGGKELGKTITKEIGGSLGKTLGGFAGPLGGIVGGVLGDVVSGLFKKTERGSAQITSVDQAAVVNGNYSAVQSDLGGLATNVQTGIRQIADALGADVGSFAVSINKYKDSYRVDPSGGTSVGGKYGTNDGVLKFDNDPEGAVRAAIANALQDGAIKGISDASQRILAAGKDLETAIGKAVLIEAIPKDLKAMLDPVGAQVDELNRKWKKTVDALKEGGASAEQMAQAQQLYNLQLEQAKNSTSSASATLKDFLSGLKLGSNSPYSLRDQEAAAMAKLQPFLDQIAAGQSIDQSAYQAAANTAIDIERQIYGSTKEFFDFLDLVQGTTNKAISAIDNAVPVTAAVESPFASATATSTAATAKNTETANDLLDQLSQQMAKTNELLARMGAGGGLSGYMAEGRNFVA